MQCSNMYTYTSKCATAVAAMQSRFTLSSQPASPLLSIIPLAPSLGRWSRINMNEYWIAVTPPSCRTILFAVPCYNQQKLVSFALLFSLLSSPHPGIIDSRDNDTHLNAYKKTPSAPSPILIPCVWYVRYDVCNVSMMYAPPFAYATRGQPSG